MNEDPMAPTPEDTALDADAPVEQEERNNRIFLCVVDNTLECRNAIYFAARRAARTGGRLALLYIMEPAEFQHWMSVEEKMREEAREEAEGFLQQYSSEVQEWTDEMPTLYLREEAVRDDSRADRRGAADLDPGAWGRGRQERPRTAGIVDRWQDVRQVSHPDHYRSRQSEPGTA